MPGLQLQQYQEKPSTPENMVGLIKYSSVIIKYIQNSNLVYAHYQYNNLFLSIVATYLHLFTHNNNNIIATDFYSAICNYYETCGMLAYNYKIISKEI